MSEYPTIGPSFEEDISYTRDTVMVAIAGFTVLIWDHLVTFDEEVEFIWKRDKSFLVYLFLFNRYLTPLGFIVNLVGKAYPPTALVIAERLVQLSHCPAGEQNCKHFVRYEGAMTVIGTQIAGLIMFLRVRALYNREKAIIWSVIALFSIWLGVNAWLLTNGQAVPHTVSVHSCTMIFKTSLSTNASASAWLPLLYDTYIFVLTLYKTMRRRGHIVRTFLSDGILYYSVICIVNVALTIMIVRAGPGVKNITAQLELLLTVAMVSRITLNLRRQALGDTIYFVSDDPTPESPRRSRTTRAGSGSAGTSWDQLRTNTLVSTVPRINMTFHSESASYPEHVLRLSTIYPTNRTSEAVEDSPVSGETPRLDRPGAEAV